MLNEADKIVSNLNTVANEVEEMPLGAQMKFPPFTQKEPLGVR